MTDDYMKKYDEEYDAIYGTGSYNQTGSSSLPAP